MMTVATFCPPHHWLIEDHRSRYSRGQCKFCGETRTFDNWLDTERGWRGQGAVYRQMADNTYKSRASPTGK